MKGFVFDVRRYAVHDGPGIRTTVFLAGCPLRCFWCHNPESWRLHDSLITRSETLDGSEKIYREPVSRKVDSHELLTEIARDRIYFEESQGGVTFSGGEPLMQPDFLVSMLEMCSHEGIHTAVDTSGHASPEIFSRIAGTTDLLLFDLKTTDPLLHEACTGQSNELIINNLRSINRPSLKLIVRIPLIPGINDDTQNLTSMAHLLSTLKQPVERIDILPFHRLGQHKYEALGLQPSPKLSNLHAIPNTREAMALFSGLGFRVKEGG